MRIYGNIFKLLPQYSYNDDLTTAEAIIMSVLLDLSRLNMKLFTEGSSIDNFFKKIDISSQYYNVVHIDMDI